MAIEQFTSLASGVVRQCGHTTPRDSPVVALRHPRSQSARYLPVETVTLQGVWW